MSNNEVIYLSSDESEQESSPAPLPHRHPGYDESTPAPVRDLPKPFLTSSNTASVTSQQSQPSRDRSVIDLTEEYPENEPAMLYNQSLVLLNGHTEPQDQYDAANSTTTSEYLPNNTAQHPDESIDVSDDDIMILDPSEAAKVSKFKSASFSQRPNTFGYPSEVEIVNTAPALYNNPAPVPHFGPDAQSSVIAQAEALRMNQLQQVRAHHMRELQVLQERTQALAQTMQAEQRNMDSAAATAIRMEKELKGLREDSEVLRLQLVQKEDEAQRLLDAYRGLNQRRKDLTNEIHRLHALMPRLQDVVRKTEVELNRLMSIQSSNMQRQENAGENRLQGYVGNVYGGNDDVDLKNLLNNIKPEDDVGTDDMTPTPPELAISLLKHQKMGLTWLLRMEESESKGGILADDMGLGKTIQALSLIVAHKSDDEDTKTTLVIAPVALLRQWAAELDSKLKSSYRFKIAIYHGNEKRVMTRFRALKGYDVVLTSYGTLSSEWKKHYKEVLQEGLVSRGQNVVPDLNNGGILYLSPFFSKESLFYRVILDEAQNIKNKNAIASKAVYCLRAKYRFCLSGTPIQNNLDELYPLLRFLRIKPYNDELKFRTDIVVPLKLKPGYNEVFSQRRSMKKLQALLSAILLRRAKDSLIDGKPILTLPEKHIEEVHADMELEEKQAYDQLEQNIQSKAEDLLLSSGLTTSILTLLLRLRQACCHRFLVEMGNLRRGETQTSMSVSDSWRQAYTGVCDFSDETVERVKLELSNDLSSESNGIKEEGIFTCPLCYDVFGRDSIILFPVCGHMICEGCVDSFFERFEVGDSPIGHRTGACFSCSRELKEKDLIKYEMFHKVHYEKYDATAIEEFFTPKEAAPSKTTNDDIINQLVNWSNGFPESTKIRKCIELLTQICLKGPDEKVIVFSQFTSLFDLLKLVLEKRGMPFLRYDGSMTLDARNSTIKNFYQGSTQILLISLRAGNVGLTLTCASNVILMDPFWNPFVEEQAMDRAHRIGQQREVYVHRLLINGTIESRIMELQKYKKELVQNALDENGMKSVSQLGRQELGFLFGLNDLVERVL